MILLADDISSTEYIWPTIVDNCLRLIMVLPWFFLIRVAEVEVQAVEVERRSHSSKNGRRRDPMHRVNSQDHSEEFDIDNPPRQSRAEGMNPKTSTTIIIGEDSEEEEQDNDDSSSSSSGDEESQKDNGNLNVQGNGNIINVFRQSKQKKRLKKSSDNESLKLFESQQIKRLQQLKTWKKKPWIEVLKVATKSFLWKTGTKKMDWKMQRSQGRASKTQRKLSQSCLRLTKGHLD